MKEPQISEAGCENPILQISKLVSFASPHRAECMYLNNLYELIEIMMVKAMNTASENSENSARTDFLNEAPGWSTSTFT